MILMGVSAGPGGRVTPGYRSAIPPNRMESWGTHNTHIARCSASGCFLFGCFFVSVFFVCVTGAYRSMRAAAPGSAGPSAPADDSAKLPRPGNLSVSRATKKVLAQGLTGAGLLCSVRGATRGGLRGPKVRPLARPDVDRNVVGRGSADRPAWC